MTEIEKALLKKMGYNENKTCVNCSHFCETETCEDGYACCPAPEPTINFHCRLNPAAEINIASKFGNCNHFCSNLKKQYDKEI